MSSISTILRVKDLIKELEKFHPEASFLIKNENLDYHCGVYELDEIVVHLDKEDPSLVIIENVIRQM